MIVLWTMVCIFSTYSLVAGELNHMEHMQDKGLLHTK